MQFAKEVTVDANSSKAMYWRSLALQFDGHRMQALWHLKAVLQDPEKHRKKVEEFLSIAPLSGAKVLEERLRDIAFEHVTVGGKATTWACLNTQTGEVFYTNKASEALDRKNSPDKKWEVTPLAPLVIRTSLNNTTEAANEHH